MTVREINEQLSFAIVLRYYNLSTNDWGNMPCPFHDDAKLSMKVYFETNSCYCFSTSCTVKSLHVVDFIEQIEKCGSEKALIKAIEILNKTDALYDELIKEDIPAIGRSHLLEILFDGFLFEATQDRLAQEYLRKRKLVFLTSRKPGAIGYNSGKFLEEKVKEKEYYLALYKRKKIYIQNGHYTPIGDPVWVPFGKFCICFPLRDPEDRITGLYFRSIHEGRNKKHLYLPKSRGLYPYYPTEEDSKIILTTSIIDAASVFSEQTIINNYGVLALQSEKYINQEQCRALADLRNLEEVILFFNGRPTGKAAVQEHKQTLKKLLPNVLITNVPTPTGEDVNSLLQNGKHLYDLVDRRTAVSVTDAAGGQGNYNNDK